MWSTVLPVRRPRDPASMPAAASPVSPRIPRKCGAFPSDSPASPYHLVPCHYLRLQPPRFERRRDLTSDDLRRFPVHVAMDRALGNLRENRVDRLDTLHRRMVLVGYFVLPRPEAPSTEDSGG